MAVAIEQPAAGVGNLNSLDAATPERVRRVLADLPFRGIHRWLFHAACTCVEQTGWDDGEILGMLYASTRGARRRVSRREIAAALADARRRCGRHNAGQPAPVVFAKRWPDLDPGAIGAISKTGPSLYDLWESSPCRFDDDLPHTEEVIDALFPGDPLLCCGLDSQQFATRRRSAWRGHLSRLALIVPNPMLSRNALTQDGRLSEHTKAGTTGRVYLVIEFDRDELSLDIQAALHADLARRFPLVADAATWSRSQFCRMPDGRRDDGCRQTVFYFDPSRAVLP